MITSDLTFLYMIAFVLFYVLYIISRNDKEELTHLQNVVFISMFAFKMIVWSIIKYLDQCKYNLGVQSNFILFYFRLRIWCFLFFFLVRKVYKLVLTPNIIQLSWSNFSLGLELGQRTISCVLVLYIYRNIYIYIF